MFFGFIKLFGQGLVSMRALAKALLLALAVWAGEKYCGGNVGWSIVSPHF